MLNMLFNFRVMNIGIVLLILTFLLASCVQNQATQPTSSPSLCTNAWYEKIDQQVFTQDGQGHGPDLGSEEWQSVVEFKLGVRNLPEVPARNTQAWCQYIKTHLINHLYKITK